MGKGQYAGVAGVARKVAAPFVGVAGVARKVKAGFVGVAGAARSFLGRAGIHYSAGYEREDRSWGELSYDCEDTIDSGHTGVSGTVWFSDTNPAYLEDADTSEYLGDLTVPDFSISFAYEGDPLGQTITVGLSSGLLSDINGENSGLSLSNLAGSFTIRMTEEGVRICVYLSGRVQSKDGNFRDVNIIGDGSYITADFTLYTD